MEVGRKENSLVLFYVVCVQLEQENGVCGGSGGGGGGGGGRAEAAVEK